MLKFDKEVVKKIFIEEGYHEGSLLNAMKTNNCCIIDEYGTKKFVPYQHVEYTDDKLIGLKFYDSKLQPILDAYVANRTINNDINVDGLTMQIIMKKNNLKFWDAFEIMSLAVNDHEYAKKMLIYGNFRI